MTEPAPTWEYIETGYPNVQLKRDTQTGDIDLEALAGQIASAVGNSWQARLVRDLPRCPHGRIDGDTCAGWAGPRPFDGGCYGGVSVGNPKLPVGQVFAYGLSGMTNWVMPPREQRDDPAAWTTG